MTYTPVYTTPMAVYNKSGLTQTEIDLSAKDDIIQDAEYELELITGRKFTSANSKTEILTAGKKDIFNNSPTNCLTASFPIQSITSLNILDSAGAVTKAMGGLTSVQIAAGTFSNSNYWLETMEDSISGTQIAHGVIRLKTDVFPAGYENIQIVYTYGYTSVPVPIRTLASCIAGIKAWVSFLGGQYNRLDSYSIPQQSVSKGDFYERGKKMIEMLNSEANILLDRIGRRERKLFFASSSSR